ncbi:LIM domain transcription factor LMO4.2-like isoform X1 [Asterias rubens]|uniref:LIM domain transcription factor LMO4.2-like isoform X1 n=2 Tax=Asterias TaxID=7601 RepID=UPI0014552193|nr:LIM domain transcription factor LMO4.2-like isoform X1 [Asterias rubens]XP_033643088.1 LIM domain transcription factor LMO4.2-like isoform X1 [Asterias rubens]XP_033643089.1 LIM domain transcription factor LMO4.2-like isoform X1 [Asterias rubens]
MAQTIDSVAGCDVVQSEISKETRSSNGSNNNNNNNNVRCCAACGCKIIDRFLLHAVDRFWHTGCLKCTCCSVQLGEVGPSCFSKGGMILCKKDYIRLFGVSGACAACAQQIPASELVMRTHNKVYHLKCFSCSSCHIQLVPGDRYTLINGSLVCENDHSKLFKAHGMTTVAGFRPGLLRMELGRLCGRPAVN